MAWKRQAVHTRSLMQEEKGLGTPVCTHPLTLATHECRRVEPHHGGHSSPQPSSSVNRRLAAGGNNMSMPARFAELPPPARAGTPSNPQKLRGGVAEECDDVPPSSLSLPMSSQSKL